MPEKTKAELQEEIDLLQQQLKKAEHDKQELQSLLDDADKQIEKLEGRKPTNQPTVELNDVRYTVLAPSFRLGTKTYGVRDLRDDTALIKKVLAIKGQRILQPEND